MKFKEIHRGDRSFHARKLRPIDASATDSGASNIIEAIAILLGAASGRRTMGGKEMSE